MSPKSIRVSLGALVIAISGLITGCGGGDGAKAHPPVTIDSTPESGASISINGEPKGTTPYTATDLAPGFYEVIVKKETFKDGYEQIQIKGDAPATFSIPLEPYVGYLSVETKPDGAEVFLDGTSLGTTPIIQKGVPVGNHTYEVKLADYYELSETLEVQRDYKYDKRHDLKPIESTINISSRPTGAHIYINNELQSEVTPHKFTLPAGTYLIGTWSTGYVQEEQKIVLAPNRNETFEFIMKAGDVPQGMVLVPAGPFIWGADGRAPDESPKRTHDLPAYYIDKYEVTNAQFKEVFPEFTFPKGRELHPASGITWSQAMKYAQLVGKRLPTEAEWEKAARGTDGRDFPWGDTFFTTHCNSLEAKVDRTVRVGERLEGGSPYGLMDMAGNVAEWTFDWYEQYPGNRDVTKDYGQVYRVLRGGSYKSEKFDVRCARRLFDKMDVSKPEYGFRCAKDVEARK